jgi:hypothetical protein
MMRKVFISLCISSFVFTTSTAQFNIPKQKPRNQSAFDRVVSRPVYETATRAATVAPAAETAVATTAVAATTATATAMPSSAYPSYRAVKSAGTTSKATNYYSRYRTYTDVPAAARSTTAIATSTATATATVAYPSYDRKAPKAKAKEEAKAPASRSVALPIETIPPAKRIVP